MGVVVLARTAGAGGFERFFALKVMHPHLCDDANFVGMLLDEARLAAKIHHPNIVSMVDVHSSEHGHCLVMDYVEGFQLLELLEHPELSPQQRMRVGIRVLLDAMAGLEAAHNLRSDDGMTFGLVHRDVSPQNILVGLDGVGRLTDFGIAQAASRLTGSMPGMIKGKPAYMAPEQARATRVDRRADIWALGVILWEILVGERLFLAETDAATVLAVVDKEILPPSAIQRGLPAELDAICLRALERNPANRWDTAREMAGELERAASRVGLLADSHEVSDRVRQIFAVRIDRRKKAIRRNIAALGKITTPASGWDVYQLPSLDAESEQPAATSRPPEAQAPGATPLPMRSSQNTGQPMSSTGGSERRSRFGLPLVFATVMVGAGVLGWSLWRSSLSAKVNGSGASPVVGAPEASDGARRPGEPEVSPGPPIKSAEPPPEASSPKAESLVSSGSKSPARVARPADPRGTSRATIDASPKAPTTSEAKPPPARTAAPAGNFPIEENPYRLR
jgi:serine/threonine protein kinase